MKIDSHLKTIQDSCNDFIERNIDEVLNQLEQNRKPLNSNFSEIGDLDIEKNSWGVYVFYIESKSPIDSYEKLCELWQTDSKGNKLMSPKPIKGRFNSLDCDKRACFYLGKSENLRHRISQHIHQKTAASTYGLKLSAHDRLHENNLFSYSYCTLKVNPVKELNESMKFLLVSLESHLRRKLEPLIGKQ
ncbi:MAG TPA: hypothetical protein DIW47_12000 [Bacteroidetes bacterium]|nr:hypothetical protein [Bacteroidota bacterium]